jgi:hypothetical protein
MNYKFRFSCGFDAIFRIAASTQVVEPMVENSPTTWRMIRKISAFLVLAANVRPHHFDALRSSFWFSHAKPKREPGYKKQEKQ